MPEETLKTMLNEFKTEVSDLLKSINTKIDGFTKQITAHDVEIVNIKSNLVEHGKDIKEAAKKPPTWVGAVISVLTFLLGISVTIIGFLAHSK